jgi:glutamate---cysteine ligase / carboxylate-amine ligase
MRTECTLRVCRRRASGPPPSDVVHTAFSAASGIKAPVRTGKRREPDAARAFEVAEVEVHVSTNQPMTFGVEEEFLVIDAESGELVPRSKELLPEARLVLGDDVSPELNLCQIEVGTPVCTTSTDLRDHLVRLRQGLSAAAGELGLGVVATGTHPFTSWSDQEIDRTSERFSHIEDVYEIVARQQVICGCHVHVGIDDPDLAIAVMNHCTPFLGPLLALAGNSPFWHGVDSGYDSYRTQVWERWPTAGPPPVLQDRADYDALVARLQEIDAIEDASYLYWHVRPAVRYPTIEFRIGDVLLHPDDAVGYAALIRALVWTTARAVVTGRTVPPPEHDLVVASIWRAGRYGLGEQLVSPTHGDLRSPGAVLTEVLDHCRDGLEAHGDHELVEDFVARLLTDGNGATRQRQWFAERGDPRDVVDRLVAETSRS